MEHLRLGARAGSVAAAILLGLTFISGPALAEPASPHLRVDRALAAAGVSSQASPANITLDGKIELAPDRPAVRLAGAGATVSITQLADAAATADARSSTSRAFGATANDTDSLVQVADGGAQIISVMHSSRAPSTQRYLVGAPAGSHLVASGAAVNVVSENGQLIARIAEPWAKDATGTALRTNYAIDGMTLIQRTDTRGAAFPVVADPKITGGWGVYLGLTGYELKVYGAALIGVGGYVAALGCASISKIPHVALRALAYLICGAGFVNLPRVWNAIKAAMNNPNLVNNQCYQMKIIPMNATWTPVSRGNCS